MVENEKKPPPRYCEIGPPRHDHERPADAKSTDRTAAYDYELFNPTTLNYTIVTGITTAAGTRLALL